MKKKLLAWGLSLVVTAGVMTGCATSNNARTEVNQSDSTENEICGEVRYAFWDVAQQPYLEKCVEEFHKLYPEVEIVLEPSGWDDYWTKLEAGATGGGVADVFWMNGPNIIKYADGDILMPIDDMLRESEIKLTDYPESLVELYHVEGKQYAIPKDFDTIGVWYNKRIFDDAGVPYPESDWTWEDMSDVAKQLTKTDQSIYGIGAPYANHEGFYNTIYAAGGEVISRDKKASGFDKSETQAGIQCWIDLQEAGSSPTQASLEETTAASQFLSGKLAMCWTGSWFLAQVTDSELKDDIDVAELPSMNGNKATIIHGLGNCIYRDTENPDAAWKWVEFLASETANTISAEMGAAIPAMNETADPWIEKYPAYNLSSFITSAEEYSYAYPVSQNTPEWQQYEADNLKRAFSMENTVKDACEQLTVQMNEVLANE